MYVAWTASVYLTIVLYKGEIVTLFIGSWLLQLLVYLLAQKLREGKGKFILTPF